MTGKTLTRSDLAESFFRKVGLSRTESAELLETVIDEICNAIVRG
ncbi:integration host factor subunit alpha, partial [Rhizobium leguminosarum]